MAGWRKASVLPSHRHCRASRALVPALAEAGEQHARQAAVTRPGARLPARALARQMVLSVFAPLLSPGLFASLPLAAVWPQAESAWRDHPPVALAGREWSR